VAAMRHSYTGQFLARMFSARRQLKSA